MGTPVLMDAVLCTLAVMFRTHSACGQRLARVRHMQPVTLCRATWQVVQNGVNRQMLQVGIADTSTYGA